MTSAAPAVSPRGMLDPKRGGTGSSASATAFSATEPAAAFSATAADNARDDEHTVARSAGRPARCALVAARDAAARGQHASAGSTPRSGAAVRIFKRPAAAQGTAHLRERGSGAGGGVVRQPLAAARRGRKRSHKSRARATANIVTRFVARSKGGGALSTSYAHHMRCPQPWLHKGAANSARQGVRRRQRKRATTMLCAPGARARATHTTP